MKPNKSIVVKVVIAVIICSVVFCFCTPSAEQKQSKVTTVAYVDLERYMGRWYEVSSYPQWFEKGMSNVSAMYTAKDDYVEVRNSGIKDGKFKEVWGKAKVIKGFGNSRLKVSFFGPFYGKYWIIDLSPDYSWAVVSNPKRTTLWVLCRTKTMDTTLYDSILKRLSTKSFDTSKLVMMRQE